MKKMILAGVLVFPLLLTGVNAQGQKADPCEGLDAEGNPTVVYQDHCIQIEPSKGPVQGVFGRRIEDLSSVTLEGPVIVHTTEGWVVVDAEFTTDAGEQFANVAVGDSWHMEVDVEQES